MNKKKTIMALFCLLLSFLLCTGAYAEEALTPQYQVENGYSVNSDGEVSPLTYYIHSVRSTITANGSKLTYTLYAGCVYPVQHIQARAVVQRLVSGNWENYVTGYYHAYNSVELSTSDSLYNVPAGQYRIVVDYTAEDTYTDYVYDQNERDAYVF